MLFLANEPRTSRVDLDVAMLCARSANRTTNSRGDGCGTKPRQAAKTVTTMIGLPECPIAGALRIMMAVGAVTTCKSAPQNKANGKLLRLWRRRAFYRIGRLPGSCDSRQR